MYEIGTRFCTNSGQRILDLSRIGTDITDGCRQMDRRDSSVRTDGIRQNGTRSL